LAPVDDMGEQTEGHVLAIDQGTTSIRTMMFDSDLAIKLGQEQVAQHYPRTRLC
jgi:glycerol kinase